MTIFLFKIMTNPIQISEKNSSNDLKLHDMLRGVIGTKVKKNYEIKLSLAVSNISDKNKTVKRIWNCC